MDRKLAIYLLARTMWSIMYDTVESTVQFCRQKPNVHNSTLLKNTYEVATEYQQGRPQSFVSKFVYDNITWEKSPPIRWFP